MKYSCKKIIVYPFIAVLILTLALGCGGDVSVSGRVTFPDGTPLTVGAVVFETSDFYATGPIDSNGYYTMATNSGPGIPRGTYQVTIQDTHNPREVYNPNNPDLPPRLIWPTERLIDPKFGNLGTSGLVCEVKGRTKFDITVTKPGG